MIYITFTKDDDSGRDTPDDSLPTEEWEIARDIRHNVDGFRANRYIRQQSLVEEIIEHIGPTTNPLVLARIESLKAPREDEHSECLIWDEQPMFFKTLDLAYKVFIYEDSVHGVDNLREECLNQARKAF